MKQKSVIFLAFAAIASTLFSVQVYSQGGGSSNLKQIQFYECRYSDGTVEIGVMCPNGPSTCKPMACKGHPIQ